MSGLQRTGGGRVSATQHGQGTGRPPFGRRWRCGVLALRRIVEVQRSHRRREAQAELGPVGEEHGTRDACLGLDAHGWDSTLQDTVGRCPTRGRNVLCLLLFHEVLRWGTAQRNAECLAVGFPACTAGGLADRRARTMSASPTRADSAPNCSSTQLPMRTPLLNSFLWPDKPMPSPVPRPHGDWAEKKEVRLQ